MFSVSTISTKTGARGAQAGSLHVTTAVSRSPSARLPSPARESTKLQSAAGRQQTGWVEVRIRRGEPRPDVADDVRRGEASREQ